MRRKGQSSSTGPKQRGSLGCSLALETPPSTPYLPRAVLVPFAAFPRGQCQRDLISFAQCSRCSQLQAEGIIACKCITESWIGSYGLDMMTPGARVPCSAQLPCRRHSMNPHILIGPTTGSHNPDHTLAYLAAYGKST